MKAAYLPLYVRDWRSDPKAALLPWTERAIYLDMLLLSWELGPLPDDPVLILRGIGCDLPQDVAAAIVRRVLEGFWRPSRGGWRNARLEAERDRVSAMLDRRSDRSRRGAAARWGQRAASPAVQGDNARPDDPEVEKGVTSPISHPAQSGGKRGSGGDRPVEVLPGIEINPPKGKAEPTQGQVDGFVARGVWQRAWQARYGTPCVLRDKKSAAVRIAYVRLGRDEGKFREVCERFLAAPPFKHRENPDPIGLLDSLDAVVAGLNGKPHASPTASTMDRIRQGQEELMRSL